MAGTRTRPPLVLPDDPPPRRGARAPGPGPARARRARTGAVARRARAEPDPAPHRASCTCGGAAGAALEAAVALALTGCLGWTAVAPARRATEIIDAIRRGRDALGEGFLLSDPATLEIVHANAAAADVFNRPLAELIGLDARELVLPARPRHARRAPRLRAAGHRVPGRVALSSPIRARAALRRVGHDPAGRRRPRAAADDRARRHPGRARQAPPGRRARVPRGGARHRRRTDRGARPRRPPAARERRHGAARRACRRPRWPAARRGSWA